MLRNAPQSGGNHYAAAADWLANGRAYAALTRLAFQRQLAYRFANLSGFLMPVAFLPDWMQTLVRFAFFPSMINTVVEVYFVVPGALLVYYPALFFLGKPDPLGLPPFMPFLAPLAGFGALAAFAFWNLGVRRYTSTGT